MLEKFRERRNEESGFTLVELLVVMLILGILAAIAIPAFFSQRDKGYDSDAKANARTVQTALETYAVDNNGSYSGATMANLATIEGTIADLTGTGGGTVAISNLGTNTYTVTATSASQGATRTFVIARAASGSTTNTCSPNGGGCSSTGTW